ncbi:fucolectin-like isoform X1 [Mytilus californianus]|uniref:fucolectin-like isoform X1 n=1 Tax=Mytilus californianus TaxID=6549 RepID=UPI002247A853|nr:fucolectin-like isoform X1 [Mytilus californianus]
MMSRAVIGLLYIFTSCVFSDVNIALNKPTTMSSIYEPEEGYHCCNSELAVDGEKPGWVGADFLCAHTAPNDNQQPWWAVDLQNVYDINLIHIHGRTDCCPNHLVNFDVEVIMPTCTCNRWNNLDEGNIYHCHYQATESQNITINCPPNTKGRIVRIKRRDTVNLVICEIEINGNPINSLLKSDFSSTYTTYACGKIGYGYIGPVLETSVAQHDIQCTRRCITNTACAAAEYDKKTNVCTLKGQCTNDTQSSFFPDTYKHVFFIQ